MGLYDELFFFGIALSEDEGGGADGDDGGVLQIDAVLVLQDLVHIEGSCIAGGVTQDVLQLALLATLYAYDAVTGVYAGVNGLDGFIDGGAFDVTAEDIVAHLQGDYLLIVEYILHNNDATQFLGIFLFLLVQVLVPAGFLHLARPQADTELTVTVGADEHQLLSVLILFLVKGNVIVALGTTYSLHS